MIGELYTPPMHRDLISSGMMMPFEFDPTMYGMGSMYGGMGMGMGMYNTNYLGGVSLKPNLSRDTVHILRSKDSEARKDMLNFGKVALGVIGISVLTGLFKGKKTPWYSKAGSSISNGVGNIRSHLPKWLGGKPGSTPTPTPTPTP